MGKNAFMTKKNLLTSQLDLELRKSIVKAIVWSVALYGAETSTITQKHRKMLEGFEIWIWRKMLKISWTQKVRNQELLNMIHEETIMISSIHQLKVTGSDTCYGMTVCLTELLRAESKGREEEDVIDNR